MGDPPPKHLGLTVPVSLAEAGHGKLLGGTTMAADVVKQIRKATRCLKKSYLNAELSNDQCLMLPKTFPHDQISRCISTVRGSRHYSISGMRIQK
jgi:hypothetical protein